MQLLRENDRMSERPSDRAIAQAFVIESECRGRNFDDVRAGLFVEHVLSRARTLDAAPSDPPINPSATDSKLIEPSAECWRRASAETFAGPEWPDVIEQRAREIAREGK